MHFMDMVKVLWDLVSGDLVDSIQCSVWRLGIYFEMVYVVLLDH